MSFIILDRDGVINHESIDYIKSPAEWLPIPGSLSAIARLNQYGFKILLATNQSGIGRGFFNLNMLHLIHEKLTQELAGEGGKIEAIFFCPHHPDDKCICRKPNTGMIQQMQQTYSLQVEKTFFIGDSLSDMTAALSAGCLPILVLTGNGQKTLQNNPILQTIPHFSNLATAVDYVLSYQY